MSSTYGDNAPTRTFIERTVRNETKELLEEAFDQFVRLNFDPMMEKITSSLENLTQRVEAIETKGNSTNGHSIYNHNAIDRVGNLTTTIKNGIEELTKKTDVVNAFFDKNTSTTDGLLKVSKESIPTPNTYASVVASPTKATGKPQPVPAEKRRFVIQTGPKDKEAKVTKDDQKLLESMNQEAQAIGITTGNAFVKVQRNKNKNISLLARSDLPIEKITAHSTRILKRIQTARPESTKFYHPVMWNKFILHGVSIGKYLTDDLEGMDRLKNDIEGFNDFQMPLRPSWIRKPEIIHQLYEGGQQNSAVIVTYTGNKMSKNTLDKGISVRGLSHKAVPFIPSDKDVLCGNCSKWGHSGYSCREETPKCGLCSEAHKTTTHKCGDKDCKSKIGSPCKHLTFKCPNCNGKHRATAKECPKKQEALEEAKKDRAARQAKEEEKEKADAMDVEEAPKGKEKDTTTAPPSPVQQVQKQTAAGSSSQQSTSK
jgi:hypothetical protein